MSRMLFSVLVFSFVYTAHCEEFIFPKDNPCILDSMTASFNLSVSGDKQESVEFDLKGAAVNDSESSCGNTADTLVIELSEKDKLALDFAISSEDVVSLTMQYTFDIGKRFPDSIDIGTVVLISESIDLGLSYTSYLCRVPQTFTFRGKTNANDYTLKMILSSVHMQAFNIQDGSFSQVEICKKDKIATEKETAAKSNTTTAKPTTTTAKPTTTTAKPTTTTAKPTTTTAKPTTTTAKPTTTTAKPTTTTAKPTTTTAKPTTTTAKPTTTTAKPKTTTAKPKTTTPKPKTTTPKPKTTTAKPKTTTAKPKTTTPKPKTTTAKPKTTTAKPKTTTAKPKTTTAKPKTTTAKPKTTTAKPKTTTPKPMTTAKPTTTMSPPSRPPLKTYIVTDYNVTCIILQARIDFDITYMLISGKPKTVLINAPNETTGNGKCSSSNDVQVLDLHFNGGWLLSFSFYSTGKGLQAAANDARFYLGNMTFNYTLSPDFFPDAEKKNHNFIVSTNLKYEASGGGSYKCNSDQSINLQDNVTVHTTDLQFKAFGKDNSTKFSDSGITNCKKDEKGEGGNIVPIAVGVALALLVVIVIIAYFIGRHRRNKGYQSI